MMKRRDFIAGLGGAVVVGPRGAWGQQTERVRRIGVLNSLASNDSEGQSRIAAFVQGLQQAGWTVGRNLQIDFRWAAGRVDDHRKLAMELIALKPEVILATGSAATEVALSMRVSCKKIPVAVVRLMKIANELIRLGYMFLFLLD